MEQRGTQGLGVQPHPCTDLGHPDRVDDEVLARATSLIGVVDARIDERLLDAVAVDCDGRVVGMLFDDRKQIAEQAALGRRQLRASDRRSRRRVLDPVDRRPRRNQRFRASARAPARLGARAIRRGLLAAARRRRACVVPAQALRRGFSRLRNRRPSSYRCS